MQYYFQWLVFHFTNFYANMESKRHTLVHYIYTSISISILLYSVWVSKHIGHWIFPIGRLTIIVLKSWTTWQCNHHRILWSNGQRPRDSRWALPLYCAPLSGGRLWKEDIENDLKNRESSRSLGPWQCIQGRARIKKGELILYQHLR